MEHERHSTEFARADTEIPADHWERVRCAGELAERVESELRGVRKDPESAADGELPGFEEYVHLIASMDAIERDSVYAWFGLSATDTYVVQAHWDAFKRGSPLLGAEQQYLVHLLRIRPQQRPGRLTARARTHLPGLSERWLHWLASSIEPDIPSLADPYDGLCEWTVEACHGLHEWLIDLPNTYPIDESP